MTDPVTKLPNHEKALVEERKLTRYLLSLESEKGRSKAQFFLARGFTPEAWTDFAEALCQHAANNKVAKIETTPFGLKYVIECNIQTPDQRSPCIRTIWSLEEDAIAPRLVTAYPHL